MPIKPTPIQLVRSRFDEITQWHAQGVRWSEIGKQIQVADVAVNTNTLRTLYRRELIRRSSPEYAVAMRWVLDNVEEITRLRNRGFTWSSIAILLPVTSEQEVRALTLDMLIIAAESVVHKPSPNPTTHQPNRDLASVTPATVAPVDPPTQQGIQALKTEHESPAIRIPSCGHEVKTMDMSIKPTPIQLVRSHFHKIAQWRSQGIPWAQIGDELKLLNITISTGTLRTLYRQERLRHGSPGYIAATQWVTTNRITIAEQLNKGVDWGTIIAIVPPDNASDGKPPKLEMLIEAYTSIVDRTAPSPAPTPLHQSDAEPDSASPFHRVT